jgi:O-antigen/teichoic acid export membrane protein
MSTRLRSLFRHGLLLSTLNILGGSVSYAFQLLLGRFLSPSEFALYGALGALIVVFSAPMGAMSLYLARIVSGEKVMHDGFFPADFYWKTLRASIYFSGVFLVVFGIFANFIQSHLKSQEFTPIAILGFLLVINIFVSINSGFIQGMQLFLLLGLVGLAGVILKLILGIPFVAMGFGVNGVMFGLLLAIGAVCFMGVYFLIRLPRSLKVFPEKHIRRVGFTGLLPILIANIAIAALTQLDIVFVNWFFSPEEAGMYAAASVLGKAVLYIPSGLITVLFAFSAEDNAKGVDGRGILIPAVLLSLFLCGCIAMLYWLFGVDLIKYVYGEAYFDAGEILRWYGLAVLPISMMMLAESFLIARGRLLFSWLILLSCPFQYWAIYLWHEDFIQILFIIGVSGMVLVILGYGIMMLPKKTFGSIKKIF